MYCKYIVYIVLFSSITFFSSGCFPVSKLKKKYTINNTIVINKPISIAITTKYDSLTFIIDGLSLYTKVINEFFLLKHYYRINNSLNIYLKEYFDESLLKYQYYLEFIYKNDSNNIQEKLVFTNNDFIKKTGEDLAVFDKTLREYLIKYIIAGERIKIYNNLTNLFMNNVIEDTPKKLLTNSLFFRVDGTKFYMLIESDINPLD